MTEILCRACDFEIFNDRNELNYYLTSCRKRYDRGLYYKYIINNINLNNIKKYLIIIKEFIKKNLISIFLIVWFR